MDHQSKIILISGPTASGKSRFAINLAKKINAEIINADSMQVYKELKILTARPNLKEQKTSDFSQNDPNANNRVIIINNQQPYYYPDPTASAMNGFITGMLVGELLDDDCL